MCLTEIPMLDMKLIPGLDLAPSCRIIWLSEEARTVWAPIIPKVSSLVSELEVLSVAKGHRPCAWQTIGEEEFPRLAAEWAALGLVSLPIKRVRNFTGFAHRHEEPVAGERASLCVIVARTLADTLRFKAAFEQGDNDTQGELLGFPKCCRTFFCESWARRYFDPVWQAALNSKHTIVGERHIRVEGHPFANPILRYTGLRVGFHIPHALDCLFTGRVATERMELAKATDSSLTKLLGALLSMPMSWDVFHGVAVVRTPIFYIITPSVPTAERHVVEFVTEPEFRPRESVRGIGFPFEKEN
jgi:hypothetical protein